jgi:hypothetical protein
MEHALEHALEHGVISRSLYIGRKTAVVGRKTAVDINQPTRT